MKSQAAKQKHIYEIRTTLAGSGATALRRVLLRKSFSPDSSGYTAEDLCEEFVAE